MDYKAPFGASAGSAYINGNPATGTQGSIPPAEAIEHPQREVVDAIAKAGLTPSSSDLGQLAKAMQTGKILYGGDTGTTDALVLTLSPTPDAYYAGMVVRIRRGVYSNISTSPTLNINGLGAKTILRRNGSAVAALDLPAGAVLEMIYDGSAFRLTSFGQAEVPRNSTPGNPTIYVRTDGSDSNDGSANTSGAAFLTIAGALASAATTLNLAGKTLTIQLGNAGVYTAPATLTSLGGTVIIQGDAGAPSAYTIQGSGPATSGQSVIVVRSGAFQFNGLILSNLATFCHMLTATTGSTLALSNVIFGAVGGNSNAFIQAGDGASITLNSGCVFTAPMGYLLLASGGSISVAPTAITINNTPAFSIATVAAIACGTVIFQSGASFSGAATGVRYIANSNGVINTAGGGANFIAGNSAGSTATGGQYA